LPSIDQWWVNVGSRRSVLFLDYPFLVETGYFERFDDVVRPRLRRPLPQQHEPDAGQLRRPREAQPQPSANPAVRSLATRLVAQRKHAG
jgi:hypothetical protein